MTPIFSRSWLMKMTVVFVFETVPVSLRSAWLMSRACRPMCASPIAPSISALRTRAARETAHAEREVEGQRTARDHVDALAGDAAELHDRAFPELLLDLEDGLIDRFGTLCHCHAVLTSSFAVCVLAPHRSRLARGSTG